MAHKKWYYVLFALVVVMIFGTAAICNMCGAGTNATDKTGTEEETAAASADKPDGGTTDKDGKDASKDTDKTSDSKTSDSSSESSSASESTDGDSVAPTIKLEIYEGPTYSAADDICFYRVKATMTGKPDPTVKFSKDDSGGNWGTKKVQINIHRGQPYTLTAVAKNSAGEASASINLTWGCGSENRNPVINDITFSSASIKTGQQYDITGNVSDPDGDALTYKWTASGGAINNDSANPMKWTAPAAVGSPTITLKVTDGKGGEATQTKTVNVESNIVNLTLTKVSAEGGYIALGGVPINPGGCLFAGDAPTNKWVVGYISFDISGLANAVIQNASMTFNVKNKYGDPSFYSSICVYDTYWGMVPISISTYSIGGTAIEYIVSTTNGNFTVNNAALKTQLQAAITAGHPRFQIGVSPQGSLTDNDNAWDGIEWDQSGIALNIAYAPGS